MLLLVSAGGCLWPNRSRFRVAWGIIYKNKKENQWCRCFKSKLWNQLKLVESRYGGA